MVRLSVNVNKVATIRNSRGGSVPSVIEAVSACVEAGAPGITVHPRADARHITSSDVREIAEFLRSLDGSVEYNIEGDPRPDLLDLVHSVRPDQCTWSRCGRARSRARRGGRPRRRARRSHGRSTTCGRPRIRVSLFVDAEDAASSLGGRARRRPCRALHRAVCACLRTRRRRRETRLCRPTRRPPASRTRSGSASMRATIWISKTWLYSGRCLILMRCRSVTLSSATRCLSV